MVSHTRAATFLIGVLLLTLGLVALLLGQDWEVLGPFLLGGLILAWSGLDAVRSGWSDGPDSAPKAQSSASDGTPERRWREPP